MKSKNILLLISHLGIGGTEIQTLNLAHALVVAGYKVTTLCLYRCIPQMVQAFEKAGSRVICISPEYNCYGKPILFHRGINLIRFLYKVLKDTIKKEHFDIIHVQYMTPMATAILVLRYLLNYRHIIATAHTNADIYSNRNLKLLRFIQRHCCIAFNCITQAAEIEMFGTSSLYSDNLKLKKRNHFTIYNALPDYISIREAGRSRRNGKTITIGVVSRLESIKGMDLVVPAFARVCSASDRVRLLVVGDGTLRQLMEESAKELGVQEKVEFVGRKGQDELEGYYDQMDILLMPSRSEGFGLTAIEGMARGVVPVVSDTGGLPEVVTPDTGLLHERESVDDLAAKILELVSDEERLCRLSNGSIERAKLFTATTYDCLISSLYSKLSR